MRRSVFVLMLVLGLLAMIVVPAAAITNGQPDGNNHPYVGLLVFDDAPGSPAWRCSGSLIAPNVVLTAGHCTDGAVAARVWFAEDVTYDAVPFPLYPFGGAGSGAVEGTAYTYSEFCTGCGNGLPQFAHGDVGIVVLDEDVDVGGFALLPSVGQVGALKNKTPIDFVGYGVKYQAQVPGNQLPQPPPFYRWTGPRTRYYAPSALVSGNFVHSDEFMKLALNPGGGSGGTCFGDSGGPDLLGGTDTVLAVNSYVTNVNCSGVGYSMRVDTPAVLAWINSFLP
jgi:hypothetical protein